MAFGRVLSQRSQVAATGAATVLTLPAGVMAGDLLLCFAISRVVTTAITVSVGTWTTVLTDSSTTYSAIFARIATGTSADQITLNKANDDWCAIILRIGDHGVSNIATDIKVATSAGGTSTTPDPPSLDAGSVADWLWFAMAGGQLTATTNTLTGQPASYTQAIATKSASSTTSVSLGVAYRAVNGQTENPGTFTQNTSRAWRAQTIAVKPGTARTGARIDACPLVVTSSTTTAVSASFTPVANSVLVAVTGVCSSTGAGTPSGTVTDSLSSSWTKLDEYQASDGAGRVQIWAQDIGGSPSARTVTLTGATGPPAGQGLVLALFCLLGTAPTASILGATDHAASNLESDTIAVGSNGSLVFSMFSDSNGTGVATPGSGMMLDMAFSDGSNGQKQAAQHAAAVQNAGNFTYAVGTITGSISSFAAWELKSAVTALADGAYWGSRAK